MDQEVSQFLLDEFIEDLPKITILPSYWNERQNRVSILDNFGEVMSSQKKYVPYEKIIKEIIILKIWKGLIRKLI